jgi:hypothetical protein
MHSIEPYDRWRGIYDASEDEKSPFFGREYNEFEFVNQVYNYVIHPQWDEFGSETLYCKILFVDDRHNVAILEFIGEWNDCLHNDIALLKRQVIDPLIHRGIIHFILIGENVMAFHPSDDSYYEEWFEDVEEGWIAAINFLDHVREDFQQSGIDRVFIHGGSLDATAWRTLRPLQFFELVSGTVQKRLGL